MRAWSMTRFSSIQSIFRRRIAVALLLFSAIVLPSFAEDVNLINETLKAHGIGQSLSSLSAFLEKGWGTANFPKDMPKVPPEKSALLINIWELLALRYREVHANPIVAAQVAELARRYATGDFPLGARKIIDRDNEGGDLAAAASASLRRTELLRYNGMVALGLFGEKNPQVIESARKVYQSEDRPLIRVTYANTLALLGDQGAVADLIAEALKANSTSSVAAAHALSLLFGHSFGITPVTAIKPRREAAKQIQRWWDQEGKKEVVDRDRAIERQLERTTPKPYPLRTIEELLRAAADTNDLKDVRGSRTAWNKIHDMAVADREGLAKQLLPIVRDPDKDLDIRDQAIRWYTLLDAKKAKPVLKKLRKDPNPEIANRANNLLANLKNQPAFEK